MLWTLPLHRTTKWIYIDEKFSVTFGLFFIKVEKKESERWALVDITGAPAVRELLDSRGKKSEPEPVHVQSTAHAFCPSDLHH